MKCLIIAAGQGSRLKAIGDSKPLAVLLGLPLIERVILSAQDAGLTQFVVVTGWNGSLVQDQLECIGKSRDLTITCLENGDWAKGNGTSVLKAKAAIDEPFVLLMCDHLFDPSILSDLLQCEAKEDGVWLAVDSHTQNNGWVDEEDVTKVHVAEGRIQNIGKNIENYNAYDTGIFLCSPGIFYALEKSIEKGDASLSGGVLELAGQGKARSLDIGGRFWTDIDDEKAFKKVERRMLSSLSKTSDGQVARYLNRPVSTRISKLFLKTNLTPNAITVISFTLSMLGALFFFLGGYVTLLIGGILAQLSSIIDGCDGEVARLKHAATEFGAWFDAVLDRYADAFLCFGLSYRIFSLDQNSVVLWIGFFALLGSFLNSYTADKMDAYMRRVWPDRKKYIRLGRDFRMFVFFVAALCNQPLWGLVVIAVLMNLENIRRIIVLYRALGMKPIA